MPLAKVDGLEIEVPARPTVLQVGELAGVEIPRCCYHERPWGGVMELRLVKHPLDCPICALGGAAAWPIQGSVRHFRPEVERHMLAQRQPMLEAAE